MIDVCTPVIFRKNTSNKRIYIYIYIYMICRFDKLGFVEGKKNDSYGGRVYLIFLLIIAYYFLYISIMEF